MQTHLRALLAPVLLLCLFAFGLSDAQAAFPGQNGLIAYRHGSEIFTMNGDGSSNAAVPNTAAAAAPTDPAFSADGNRIAFVRGQDIWIISASGSGARNLTNTPDFLDAEPSWSPDGTEIAFASYRTNTWEIFVVRSSDGGGERQLTDGNDNPSRINPSTFPSWSPDGSTIAFFSDHLGAFGLYTMSADTGEPENFLVATSAANNYPAWFPDGSKIAYSMDTEIWTIEAGGANPTKVTTGARAGFGLSVSPDGTKIAFTSGRDGNNEIYVMDSNGSNQINISNSSATDDRLPDWGVPGTGGSQQGTDEDDELTGTSEADTVFAGDGNDTVNSGGGADIVFGEGGNDKINGGAGNDKLYGDSGPPPTTAKPIGRKLALQEQEPSVPGDDVLNGGGGADLAVGGEGDDTLNGGPGVDRMKAGPGEDTCVFSSRTELAKSSGCEHKKRNFKRNFTP